MRHLILALLLPGLLAALLQGCTSVNRAYEAALVLGDVAAGEEDSRLKRREATPQRETVDYRVDERAYRADVYHPERPRRGHLLLVHGFTEEGRRDPRLTAFAETLGRAGFTVFVPEVEGLRDFSISGREIRVLTDALRHSTGDTGPAAGVRTGIAAFSLAVGPAMLAAGDPAVNNQVSFIVSVGGYYDLTDTLRYVTTGVDAGGNDARPPPPQREGRWAVLLSQLHWLEDDDDRELLERIARRRMDDPHAPVAELRRQLGDEGQSVYALVTNRDPDKVDTLIEALPAAMLEEFRALDLSARDLSGVQADVVLIHGRDDRVIPFSHSERLRDTLANDREHWLYRAGGLGHVDVSPGLRDGLGLWRAAWRILLLGEREALRADERDADRRRPEDLAGQADLLLDTP